MWCCYVYIVILYWHSIDYVWLLLCASVNLMLCVVKILFEVGGLVIWISVFIIIYW